MSSMQTKICRWCLKNGEREGCVEYCPGLDVPIDKESKKSWVNPHTGRPIDRDGNPIEKSRCYDQKHSGYEAELDRLARHIKMLEATVDGEREGRKACQDGNRELIRRIRQVAVHLRKRGCTREDELLLEEIDPHGFIFSGILT